MTTWDCSEEAPDAKNSVEIEAEHPDEAVEKFVEAGGFNEDSDFSERTVFVRKHGTSDEWQRFTATPEATVVVHVYQE
jgi:hypothetical protein